MKMRSSDPDDERVCIATHMDLLHALQRRGLALQMADLLEMETHEILRRRLMAALDKKPLTGFMPVTMNQVLEVDQIIWQELSKVARGGLRRRGAVARPLDSLLPGVLENLDVKMALLPRQGHVSAPRQASQPAAESSNKLISALQKQIDELKRASAIGNTFAGSGAPKAKAAAKAGKNTKVKRFSNENPSGARSSQEIKPPPALAGCQTRSSVASGGQRMCFAYNLGTCKAKSDCQKGAHLCMKTLKTGEACSGKDCIASTCTK
jgi:hypothetical protein